MMATLPDRYSSSSLSLTKVERRAAKEIALTRAPTKVLAARESARLDVIAEVAETALLNASAISGLEAALVMRTPHAAGRLCHITDSACMAMGRVVVRTGRSL
jgi:hypothetical protein